MKNFICVAFTLVTMAMFSGCAKDSKKNDKSDSKEANAEKVMASDFVLTSLPDGATSVGLTREAAKDKDDVVVIGRIGGTTHPWVEGAAAFTLVDESLPACGDEEECGCPTPWDYCCVSSDKLAANSVTIKFADEKNRARRFSPKEVFGLAELQTIVVTGTVDRDDTGKFTILAKKLFVKK